ncbi:glycosyltransferase family 9 protein [Aristophania vespae]|uniref:glycosyltransferase family 9 protein n=1 Tax=Aristophania vespae TaxID=2697033 RepID=UPI002351B8EB|nr:glycosyltransferase family 9 protein [Aristophania vespae]UMM63558.1 hypothetical protein DM15PD_05320 [Aristophania vespae]
MTIKNKVRKIRAVLKEKQIEAKQADIGLLNLDLAQRAYEKGELQVAARLYEKGLASDPKKPDVILACAEIQAALGNYKSAEQYYLKYLDIEKNDVEVTRALAKLYVSFNDYTKALTLCKKLRNISDEKESNEIKSIIEQCKKRIKEQKNEDTYILTRDEFYDEVIKDHRIDRTLFKIPEKDLYHEHQEIFHFSRSGNHQKTKWGDGLTVRGIDSLRGYIISAIECRFVEIWVSGQLVYKAKLEAAPLEFERKRTRLKKYVYNAWIDFSQFSCGWHDVIVRALNVKGDVQENLTWKRDRIIVAEDLPKDIYQESDSNIPPLNSDAGLSVVEQVNALPSSINEASTHSFPGKLNRIAVIRADQLGDMVVSVPALKRLRELVPHAKITGVITPANEGLARSLNVFDDYIILDLPDDRDRRQRVMSAEKQDELIKTFSKYDFDVAIDLSVDGMSKRLLPMTGAPVTMGLGRGDCKTLDVEIVTHDPKTGNDVMRHSARTKLLIEAFGRWLDSGAHVERRESLNRDCLKEYGINPEDDFVVLHTGSRIKFTQWPYYTELAAEIVKETGAKVFFIADNPSQFGKLPAKDLEAGKIIYFDKLLPSDHFDALLSFCSVFVGNDSGPKHLAALRGAKVISIHSARIGWPEWGQEQGGVIISRKVPCAGCYLHHNPEECGQDVACIRKIKIEEVLNQVKRFLNQG